MPITKKRINITVQKEKADEDDIWNKLAEQRDTKNAKFVSRNEAAARIFN